MALWRLGGMGRVGQARLFAAVDLYGFQGECSWPLEGAAQCGIAWQGANISGGTFDGKRGGLCCGLLPNDLA